MLWGVLVPETDAPSEYVTTLNIGAAYMKIRPLVQAAALAFAALGGASPSIAADWSDTYIGWRYGSSFREPFVNNASGGAQNITKNIFTLSHASGFKYGINFFN